MMGRWNTKKCPNCDRKLIKLKAERYDTKTDSHISYMFGRLCLDCKTVYQSKEFENFKILVSDLGSDDQNK